MFDFIASRASEIFSTFFVPKRTTMPSTLFDFLLKPDLAMDTELFLHVCTSGIDDPQEVLSRFKVKNLSIKKKLQAPQHEFLLIELDDLVGNIDRHLIVERTVDVQADRPQDDTDTCSIIDDFVRHPYYENVIAAVSSALVAGPVSLIVGCAAGAAGPTVSGLAVAAAVVSSSSQLSNPPQTLNSLPESSTNSILDQAALNSAQFFHSLSDFAVSRRMSKSLNKPPKGISANDRWLGEDNLKFPEYGSVRGARTFEAHNLTLFHMALIVNIVHSEYPIYSLFKNNCYWFANLIYLAARIVDHSLGVRPGVLKYSEESGDMIDLFFLQFTQYLPSISGSWMGFKICDVEEIVVNHIVDLFLKKLKTYEMEVRIFIFFCSYQFANLVTVFGPEAKTG